MLCLLSLVLLSGCWSRRELNELAIILGMGIEKSGNQYLISVQVVDPKEVATQKGGSGSAPVILYTATGDTLSEAIRKVMTPRVLYPAHLRVLVIGEELAREGITEPLDLFSRARQVRPDFFVLVARGQKAEDILKVLTPLEKLPSNSIMRMLERLEITWAPTIGVTLDELLSDLSSEGKNPAIGGIRVRGDKEIASEKANIEKANPYALLQLSGIAAFDRSGKLVGWLSEEESKGLNYILGNVQQTLGIVPCPEGGKMALRSVRAESKIKGHVEKGKPRIDVEVQVESDIEEVLCSIDIMRTESIAQLEKIAEKNLQELMEASIRKAQKSYRSDIFGFGEAINRADPVYWEERKSDWNQIFPQLTVNVKTDVKIRRTGVIGDPFQEKR